jgi:hypothetical protein
MALTDFLTEGAQIPAGSAVKSITSQTVLPEWYTNYAMDILSGQQGIANSPYQTYQGPRVADFTPMQQQGFQQTQQAANAYQPGLDSATRQTRLANDMRGMTAAAPFFNQATGLSPLGAGQADFNASRGGLDNATAINPGTMAQPYYQSALAMNPLSAASGDYNAARSTIGGALGYDAPGAAQPYYNQAGSMNALGSAQPYLNQAGGYAMQSTTGDGLSAAMPWLNAASGNVANVGEYMNPYEQSVVDYIGEQGTRNLRDNIMPALEGRYITSGQFRGSGQLTDTMRAVRDTSQDILGQQAQLRQSGYVNAQNQKGSDLNRYGQLGQTAGNLAVQQQQAVANAGNMLANIGQTAGNLTAGQQQLLASMGTNLGNLTQGQQQGALAAAGQMAALGTNAGNFTQGQQQLQQNIGQSMGQFGQAQQQAELQAAQQRAGLGSTMAGLTQDQQNMLLNVGNSAGALTNTDASRMLAGGSQLANLAGLEQQYGLTGAGALGAAGAQQQGLNQQNLNVAYEDFLRQQGYPQQQIDAMLNSFKGVAAGVPSGSQEYGVVPSGVAAEYKPSTASQIASGLTGAAGLVDILKGL